MQTMRNLKVLGETTGLPFVKHCGQFGTFGKIRQKNRKTSSMSKECEEIGTCSQIKSCCFKQ